MSADRPVKVGVNHLQAAGAVLDRIAMSGLPDDPELLSPDQIAMHGMQRLALWREAEGLAGLEIVAMESAQDSAAEIEEQVEETGDLSMEQIAEYLGREYMAGFQVGWIAARRLEKRLREGEVKDGE